MKNKIKRLFLKMKNVQRSTIILASMSGFITVVVLEKIRERLPKITLKEIEEVSNAIPINMFEPLLFFMSFILLLVGLSLLTQRSRFFLIMIPLLTAVGCLIGISEGIVSQKIPTTLVFSLVVFIFSMLVLIRIGVIGIYEWLQIPKEDSEENDCARERRAEKFDLGKLTLVWVILAAIIGWLLRK